MRNALWCSLFFAVTAFAGDTRISVRAGETREVSFSQVKRLAVGDPSIADVAVNGQTVRITGVDEGKTTLIVWTADDTRESYVIEVVGSAAEAKRPAPPPAPSAGTMKEGTNQVLDIPGLRRVSVSDPHVIDVKNLGDGQLLVIAVGAGKGTLCTAVKDAPMQCREYTVSK